MSGANGDGPVAPPQNLEAEQSVLGAVLLSDTALPGLSEEGLQPEHFYRDGHAVIYRAMRDMHTAGAAVDRLTLTEHLKQTGELEAAGGAAAVDLLAGSVPAIGNVRQYARIVRDNAVLRQLLGAAYEIQARVHNHEAPPQELVDIAARAIADVAGAAQRGDTLPLLSLDELLDLPDLEWLVDGVLPAAGQLVLYGQPGTAKSFLALDWGLCIAAGVPWLGGRAVRHGHVVYIAGEGAQGYGSRVRGWLATRKLTDEQRSSLRERFNLVPVAANLLDAAAAARARRTLETLPEAPTLLVVDTVARAMAGGNENSTEDMGAFIAAVDDLRAGRAALNVHHCRREDGQERGNSALRAAADLMAKLERDGHSPLLTLTCDKFKDASEWDPMQLRLDDCAGSRVLSLVVEVEQRRDERRERVLALVRERGSISTTKARDEIGGRAKSVDEALASLERDGVIRRGPDGWQPCPASPDRVGTGALRLDLSGEGDEDVVLPSGDGVSTLSVPNNGDGADVELEARAEQLLADHGDEMSGSDA